MKRKWTLFTYPTMDIKAAEAMLNRRAEQGWRMEKIWRGLLASFVPAEEPVCYCLDWYDPSREDGLDYRTLLADAGWRRVGQLSYWNIYEAPAGTAPIQTDGELEYRRFRKKALRRMFISWLVLAIYAAVLVLLCLLVGMEWRFAATVFTDANTGIILILLVPLLLPGALKNAKAVVKYVYETYGDEVYLSLMNQYTPLEGANLPESLNRKVTKREYERLVDYALDLGVTNAFIQEGDTAKESFIPAFEGTGL